MIALQYLRSAIYAVQLYTFMTVLGIICFPWAVVDRRGAFFVCRTFCRWARYSLRVIVGLRIEFRGTPPTGQVLIASKHQAMVDFMMIFDALSYARFIMKYELIYVPILGQYVWRMGCIPIKRGRRGAAIAQMLAEVRRGADRPGQLVIYPQGTRVAPGAYVPYKQGTAILYEQLGQPCHPVATNVGLFWPRKGLLKKPGVGVIEFLDPIPPGLPRAAFMARLEDAIETRSNALMAEAGFRG